ncbi:MAG: shikimate kinase [Methanopyri archaeon]|nr:shikimate kinase [Methanopyri archaeon]
MKGKGTAYAAGTVVNAIASMKGCAYALDLKVRVTADPKAEPGIEVVSDVEDDGLIAECVREAEKLVDRDRKPEGWRIEVDSDIPVAVGLASSSAVSNAVVEACLDAMGEEADPLDVVKAGVEASIRAGVTVTGAYDDACASFLGGLVLTLNDEMTLLDVRKLPYPYAVVLLPGGRVETSSVDKERLSLLAPAVDAAFRAAMAGDYRTAMLINTTAYAPVLGHDLDPVLDALEVGASAAGLSGTGPAIVALCETRSEARSVRDSWSEHGDVILTRTVGPERVP